MRARWSGFSLPEVLIVLALVAMTLVGTFEIRMADMQERRVAGEAADFRAVERCLVRYHALDGRWRGWVRSAPPPPCETL